MFTEVPTWLVSLAALGPVIWLLFHGQFSLLAFLLILLALITAVVMDKAQAICLVLVYLFLLGDVRRIVGLFIGYPKFDPLLIVGPILTILLAVPLLLRLRLKDSLSKAMLGLMAVMALQTINPRQGPLQVGLAGAMFYVIPVLWFWIGRRYGDYKLLYTVIYKVAIPLATLAAIVGLLQTYVGFLPWQSAWIAAVSDHYHALFLGNGVIRSFGFSVNAIEFIDLLLVGAVCVASAFFAGKRFYGLLFPLLCVMLFLASSRTSIVKLVFALSAAWALSSKGGKGWTVRLPIAVAVLVGALSFGLSQAASSNTQASGAVGVSTQHQVQGLSHPLDKKHSTAGLHAGFFLEGIKEGFTNPIGNGLGSVGMGGKVGGDEGSQSSDDHLNNSEVDISDAFLSMGLVGGLLYLFIVVLIMRRAITFGRTAPKILGLPVLGLLASMGGAWIALGQYGMGPFIWFIIGCLVRDTDQKKIKTHLAPVQVPKVVNKLRRVGTPVPGLPI